MFHNEEVLLSSKADRTASESVSPFLQLLGKHMRLWAPGEKRVWSTTDPEL